MMIVLDPRLKKTTRTVAPAPRLDTLATGLLPGMQRLRSGHHANRLALQIQARRVLGHRRPITATPAPGGNTQLELLEVDPEQRQMLLGVLENALFQRHLGRRIDREGQGEVLLQAPYRLDGRVLLTRPGLGRLLALWRRRALGLYLLYLLYLLFLGPQAVA